MTIRPFHPGDELAQARIYNLAAGSLPGFKPATGEEIVRRYSSTDLAPGSRYYAIEEGEVVGYAAFGPNGRISSPWCLPGAEHTREHLLKQVLDVMSERKMPEAWAAYRADWSPVLEFLRQHEFLDKKAMINYVAKVSDLPTDAVLPPDRVIEPMGVGVIHDLNGMTPGLDPEGDHGMIENFYRDNPFHDFSKGLFALKALDGDEIRAIGLLIVDERFADPTKIDASMPCFRFGTFGTERQRHKRVNGLVSAAFKDRSEGEILLSWLLGTRAKQSGLTHIAAQAPSDSPDLCSLYDRFFQRQSSFPILARRLPA